MKEYPCNGASGAKNSASNLSFYELGSFFTARKVKLSRDGKRFDVEGTTTPKNYSDKSKPKSLRVTVDAKT